jgi:hypothetical protein
MISILFLLESKGLPPLTSKEKMNVINRVKKDINTRLEKRKGTNIYNASRWKKKTTIQSPSGIDLS